MNPYLTTKEFKSVSNENKNHFLNYLNIFIIIANNNAKTKKLYLLQAKNKTNV